MCSITSIRLGVLILSCVKVIMAAYLFFVGIQLSSSQQLQQAYGVEFIGFGVQLIFMGIISGLLVVPHWYANKRHNRFLLLVVFFFDLLVLSVDLGVSAGAAKYMVPEFSKSLQEDCLRTSPLDHTDEECAEFFTSDRTAGFRLFWEGYFTARSDVQSFQILSSIQGDTCCGFFAPMHCIENKDKFPSDRTVTKVDGTFLKQRVSCGQIPPFYPQTAICTDYQESANADTVVAGCKWDMGVGYCTEKSVFPDSAGCASKVEDHVQGLIAPHVTFIAVTAAFNGIAMLYACCMYWKRKETDIFPEFGKPHEHDIEFAKVKDQFEVVADADLLVNQGYVLGSAGKDEDQTSPE